MFLPVCCKIENRKIPTHYVRKIAKRLYEVKGKKGAIPATAPPIHHGNLECVTFLPTLKRFNATVRKTDINA